MSVGLPYPFRATSDLTRHNPMNLFTKSSPRVIPGFGLTMGVTLTLLSLVVLLPLAALVGLGAGFALTFLISQLRPAVVDPRGLRDVTGLPVLGTVSMLATPERTSARRRGLLAFGAGLFAYAGMVAAAVVALQLIQG